MTDPGHIDLMVSLLQPPARSGNATYRGVGSGHLATLQRGDTVLARIRPFRGAIADRVQALAEGAHPAPAVCYFGGDAPDADFLHAEELRAAEAVGAVSLRPAFSATPVDGVSFVQHRIAAEADEVWRLLDAVARVHVCGDGSRMAPGVRAAFRALHGERSPGGDYEQWLNELIVSGRYTEDVYAAG
ncbi:hypothetical protein ABT173_39370 [Streptomyces sp. NPDC001795]|uniref:hypothetical protein n=1 Tax=Streptomyces sp. NPDC001795 TaxID=3154525 RepID=UPI00332A8A0B